MARRGREYAILKFRLWNTAELHAKAVEALVMLLDESDVVEMMGDCVVMRDQVRGCG